MNDANRKKLAEVLAECGYDDTMASLQSLQSLQKKTPRGRPEIRTAARLLAVWTAVRQEQFAMSGKPNITAACRAVAKRSVIILSQEGEIEIKVRLGVDDDSVTKTLAMGSYAPDKIAASDQEIEHAKQTIRQWYYDAIKTASKDTEDGRYLAWRMAVLEEELRRLDDAAGRAAFLERLEGPP